MNVLDAAADKGITLKKTSVSQKRGAEYTGACPGCGGNDRFHVWPDLRVDGSYWCRGCEKAGDLVQFYVDFHGMSYPDAFKAAGRELPEGYTSKQSMALISPASVAGTSGSGAKEPFQPTHYEEPPETWQIKAGKLVTWAHGQLLENPEQLKILAERGLDLEAVKIFRLGWCPGEKGKNSAFRPRESWGLPTILKENGSKKMLWIPRGVVIPYLGTDSDGMEIVRRIRIRRPDADINSPQDVRYYVLPGSCMAPMLIFRERRAFVIVESELDAMLLARIAGGAVGVLALGSAQTKPCRESYPVLQGALRILNALDFDEAGKKAGKWWSDEFEKVRRWSVPVGKDPGDAYKAGVNLLEWVLAGLPPVLTMRFRDARFKASLKANQPIDLPQEPSVDVEKPELQQLPVTQQAELIEIPGFPRAVAELKALLDRYPVKILATKNRTKIVVAPAFQDNINNDAVIQQLSSLVFWNGEVAEFLDTHPHDYIHRGNFLAGR